MVVFVLYIIMLMPTDSSKIKAYNDSLFIYETYKEQIEKMKIYANTLNYTAWFKIQAHDDSAIACNLVRLQKYNKKKYEPSETLEIESFGLAYKYPKPYGINEKKDTLVEKKTADNFKFKIIDYQVRFILNDKNLTKIPYLNLLYYNDRGIVYKKEKIDPITLQKIDY